jgi:uncharacterized membrane protein YoaK (UPF0700 family)
MHTLNKPALLFACCLSTLAGCVDAIGFLHLGGYFVSFMSGNSTRLAVSLQHGNWQAAALPIIIVLIFVAGAAVGSIVKHNATQKRKPASVLMLVTLLLFAAGLCNSLGESFIAMLMIAMAMGAENSVIQGKGDNVIGVTYMTGTLVKIGQRIGDIFHGGEPFSWLPYLLLWTGLIIGGIAGTLLFSHYGLNALWAAIGWSGLLALTQWHFS